MEHPYNQILYALKKIEEDCYGLSGVTASVQWIKKNLLILIIQLIKLL